MYPPWKSWLGKFFLLLLWTCCCLGLPFLWSGVSFQVLTLMTGENRSQSLLCFPMTDAGVVSASWDNVLFFQRHFSHLKLRIPTGLYLLWWNVQDCQLQSCHRMALKSTHDLEVSSRLDGGRSFPSTTGPDPLLLYLLFQPLSIFHFLPHSLSPSVW